MIAALMLDLDDSPDFPGSAGQALGRPLAAYPFLAARSTGEIRRWFVVTDTPPVKAVALQNNAEIIDPLAHDHGAPGAEALLRHGFRAAFELVKDEKDGIDLLVVFLANAPAVTHELVQQGLDAMHGQPALDGAVSVSQIRRLSPWKETQDGLIEPQPVLDGAWRLDFGVQFFRPRCLESASLYQGHKILALKQSAPGPVDHRWQLPACEAWLQKHGHRDLTASMEPQPKPQLQAKKQNKQPGAL